MNRGIAGMQHEIKRFGRSPKMRQVLMRVIVKCRHPGLENEIITCEMLSNRENRD